MKKLLPLLLLVAGCTTSKCYPSKGSKDYATLISNQRTILGYKHLFVTAGGDTLTRYLQTKLIVGNCYELQVD